MPGELRAYSRIRTNADVLIIIDDFDIEAKVYDISEYGASFRVSKDYYTHFNKGDILNYQVIDVSDKLGKQYILNCKAQIIHMHKYDTRDFIVGVRIVGVDNIFKKYVEDKKAEIWVTHSKNILQLEEKKETNLEQIGL